MVGRKLRASVSLDQFPFQHKRISCLFNRTWLFYLEFNIRLFFFLLFTRQHAICAVDLDTALPALFISRLKKIPRIYDARELFTEMKPVIDRPFIQRIWMHVEKYSLPKFKWGYAVSTSIANELNRRYGVKYITIRNTSVLREHGLQTPPVNHDPYILYQGYVHEARGIEKLIKAMEKVPMKLIICGSGNTFHKCVSLTKELGLEEKVIFKGLVLPQQLYSYTENAFIGINLVENSGLNQYYSLANKFFDYMQCAIPQITMNFPEYKRINNEYEIALLIDDLCPDTIANALNSLINNRQLYKEMKDNCMKARNILNWQNEEKKLLDFYHNVLK